VKGESIAPVYRALFASVVGESAAVRQDFSAFAWPEASSV